MVVLVGIVFQVGIKIIDWGFFKCVYCIFWKLVIIMYVVIGLIVFVDLIIVVGIGVFIVNVLIIDCLIQLKFEDVKVIIDVDDVIILDNDEKELLDCVEG